jgi:TetR/AcrR family transcriptional repressor of nem operon
LSAKDCYGCVTGCGIGNLALELSTQDEEIRKRLVEIFDEWARLIERVLDEAVKSGELPAETDSRATSQAMLAYIEGVSLLGKTFNDPRMISRLGQGILSLCIKKGEGSTG